MPPTAIGRTMKRQRWPASAAQVSCRRRGVGVLVDERAARGRRRAAARTGPTRGGRPRSSAAPSSGPMM
ncbi:MAG: hypothetical protein MZV64_15250 [Ignavibacteriales bacterium]|nr:hypothetical protein [Ignavibacteriales bacterium]